MATSFRTFNELKAHAEANFPDSFRNLPDPELYPIDTYDGHVRIRVGIHTRGKLTATPVWVYIGGWNGATRLGDFYQRYITVTDIYLYIPFKWMWSSSDGCFTISNKLDAFVRFCALAKGFEVSLDEVDYDYLAVFRHLCEYFPWQSYPGGSILCKKEEEASGKRRREEHICSIVDEAMEDVRSLFAVPESLDEQFDRLATDFDALKERLAVDRTAGRQERDDLRKHANELEAELQDAKDKLEAAEDEAAQWKRKLLDLQCVLRIYGTPEE